jgi:hypothetical protein
VVKSLDGGGNLGEFGEDSARPKPPEMSSNSGNPRTGTLAEIGNKTAQGGHDMSSSSLQADQEEKKEETQEWAIEVYEGQEVDRVGAREEEDMLEFNLDEESEIPPNVWPL